MTTATIKAILAQISKESKEKAIAAGAYSGYKLVAELQNIGNKTKPVIISLKIPIYNNKCQITDHTTKLVGSNFCCGSWRGSYELPAVEYTEGTSYTVDEIIQNILSSDGEEVTGWKGGEFTLSMNDVIYIANEGCSNNATAVVKITETDDHIILETEPDMY